MYTVHTQYTLYVRHKNKMEKNGDDLDSEFYVPPSLDDDDDDIPHTVKIKKLEKKIQNMKCLTKKGEQLKKVVVETTVKGKKKKKKRGDGEFSDDEYYGDSRPNKQQDTAKLNAIAILTNTTTKKGKSAAKGKEKAETKNSNAGRGKEKQADSTSETSLQASGGGGCIPTPRRNGSFKKVFSALKRASTLKKKKSSSKESAADTKDESEESESDEDPDEVAFETGERFGGGAPTEPHPADEEPDTAEVKVPNFQKEWIPEDWDKIMTEMKEKGTDAASTERDLREISKSMNAHRVRKKTGKYLMPEDVTWCKNNARFKEKDLIGLLKRFRQKCPNGEMNRKAFAEMFKFCFPISNAEAFTEIIFEFIDPDGKERLDFKVKVYCIRIMQ